MWKKTIDDPKNQPTREETLPWEETQAGSVPPRESSIDGANSDQYAAAIITPAANPSMALRKRFPTLLVR